MEHEFEMEYECDEADYLLNIFYCGSVGTECTVDIQKVLLINTTVWMFDRKNGIKTKPDEPTEIPYSSFEDWVTEQAVEHQQNYLETEQDEARERGWMG